MVSCIAISSLRMFLLITSHVKYTSLIGVLLITTNLVCESLLSHVIDERYNVRVSTRHYKGPELLTNDMVVIVGWR